MNPNPKSPSAFSASSSSTCRATDRPSGNLGSTYNLDRFLNQDMCDDATLYGRVQEYDLHPHPGASLPFYETKAANTIGGLKPIVAGSAGTASQVQKAANHIRPSTQAPGSPPGGRPSAAAASHQPAGSANAE
ncbi:hypothetical protein N658DRAFT_495258 [Parathielavia hyrcaniae]|uniref:Uncharacterized protein n=1 Tax=Parathielavia hyrcaniae TaxID=113614 RepID=A0AAN6Q2U0_9PEZI|nr:hypothetical protein N658DRAFT_495258 [Parathielavia hyrcaniae]